MIDVRNDAVARTLEHVADEVYGVNGWELVVTHVEIDNESLQSIEVQVELTAKR